MTWFISAVVALFSGLFGLILAGFIATLCVSWFNISSREGASGYFVVFIALCGGIAGLVLGFVTARLIASIYGPGFGKELMGSLGAVILSAGLAALICRLLADIPPTLDGRELILEVEFRLPDTLDSEIPPTRTGDWRFTFASISGNTQRRSIEGTIHADRERFENGRWIVPTEAEIFTQRGRRSVTLFRSSSTEVMGFILPLPANPDSKFEQWSDWIPREQAGGQPWPSDKMSCRFRVKKVPDPNTSD